MNITQLEAKHRAAQRQIEQLSAPQRALEAAEQELNDLQQQIQAQRQQEARQVIIARLIEHASAGAQALADVQAAQQAFDVAIAPIIEAYSAAKQRQIEARSAFYAELRTIVAEMGKRFGNPDTAAPIVVELENAGADLGGVLTNLSGFERPLDRAAGVSHAYPGALHQAIREQIVHQGGHLGPPQPSAQPMAVPDFHL
jgi:DNA repair exonuclease SbcCD ATPase subunit